MKKINKKGSLILTFIGLLIIAVAQLLSHYEKISDLFNGAIMGVGIAIILISLLLKKYEPPLRNGE